MTHTQVSQRRPTTKSDQQHPKAVRTEWLLSATKGFLAPARPPRAFRSAFFLFRRDCAPSFFCCATTAGGRLGSNLGAPIRGLTSSRTSRALSACFVGIGKERERETYVHNIDLQTYTYKFALNIYIYTYIYIYIYVYLS